MTTLSRCFAELLGATVYHVHLFQYSPVGPEDQERKSSSLLRSKTCPQHERAATRTDPILSPCMERPRLSREALWAQKLILELRFVILPHKPEITGTGKSSMMPIDTAKYMDSVQNFFICQIDLSSAIQTFLTADGQ